MTAVKKYLHDHRIQGRFVQPGMLSVCKILSLDIVLSNVRFLELTTSAESALNVAETADRFDMTDMTTGTVLVSGIRASAERGNTVESAQAFSENFMTEASVLKQLDKQTIYQMLASNGNDYGPSFQTLSQIETYENAAKAQFSANPNSSAFEVTVTLLDSITHAIAIAEGLDQTFFLDSIESIQQVGGVTDSTYTIKIKQTSTLQANALVVDQNNTPIFIVKGLRIKVFGSEEAIAIVASFSIDPLVEVAAGWSRKLGQSITFDMAGFGQVNQALLGIEENFSRSTSSRFCLIRAADWLPKKERPSIPAKARIESLSEGLDTQLLPDGRTIASLNRYESTYLYQEIYKDLVYRRHSIQILDGDTVIDIGANVGMFSMFAYESAASVNVISVEPSPVVLPILKVNRELYAPGGAIYEAGASSERGSAMFTAYRNSSVFSSFEANSESDESAIRTIIENSLNVLGEYEDNLLDEVVSQMLADRMQSEQYECELISVSDIIEEQSISNIGLLKIDAEKSEDAILAGIKDSDWDIVEQVIVEVHLQDGRKIDDAQHFLESKGFKVTFDEEDLLAASGLVSLYAIKPERLARNLATSDAKYLEQGADTLTSSLNTYASANLLPLDIIFCPDDVRDPETKRCIASVESKLKTHIDAFDNVRAHDWEAFSENYPVDSMFDSLGAAIADLPYTDDWYVSAGTSLIRRHMASLQSPAKVIVCDCDNTLWHGVVGEDGVEGVQIDRARQLMFSSLRKIINSGVLLVLSSKNSEADVKAVFDNRKDFPFEWSDVVTSRIGWDDKYIGLQQMAEELNLGLDSFVFVDDSPIECAQMREQLPQVITLQMPTEPEYVAEFLGNVWAFDTNAVTTEDVIRSKNYKDEAHRKVLLKDSHSLDDFIQSLNLEIEVLPIEASNIERASQMTQRTNQFNFTTKRRTVPELTQWLEQSGASGFVVQVADKFGEYGITGLVLTEMTDQVLNVDTLLLSCRVLGRGVENYIVNHLAKLAVAHGSASIVFNYMKTERNEPAQRLMLALTGGELDRETEQCTYRMSVSDASVFKYRQPAPEKLSPVEGAGIKSNSVAFNRWRKIQDIALNWSSTEKISNNISQKMLLPRPNLEVSYEELQGQTEEAMALIWREHLGIEGIGRQDDFFLLGGTSLAAVRMIASVQKKLGLAVSVVDVFDRPTIARLCDTHNSGENSSVDVARNRGSARRAARPTRRSRTNNS